MFKMFKGPDSRLPEYKKTQEGIEKNEAEIEEMESPLGQLQTDALFSNICHESLNMIASIPNIPRRTFLEMKVKLAQQKLESIEKKDKEEATRLNNEYNKIIKAAIASGGDTERKKFEREMLGIKDKSDAVEG
jgi:hypothetical protein